MEAEKDKGFVKAVEVDITKVLVEEGREAGEAKKITFETSKGNITWKPKDDKTEYRDGLAIQRKVPSLIEDLPQKVKDIGKEIIDKGKCVVLVNYNWWETNQDGEAVTYRFITSKKTLDDWKIIKEEVKEEIVNENKNTESKG